MNQKGTLDLHRARVGTTHRTRGWSTKIQGQTSHPGKLLEGNSPGEGKVALPFTHHNQPGRELTTDNRHLYELKCKISCCTKCSYCARAFPKERSKSRVSRLLLQKLQIKVCEKCFLCHSIVLCSTCNKCKKCCLKSACRARLQNFWQIWLDLGAGPKVVQTLKEGYTLPFRIRPTLTRSPSVISCYVNPHRNTTYQLIDKNAVELVQNQTSLGVFNRLFLVPKPNNKWRPILDLSNLNLFLKAEKLKMETPETIRTSLQQGEWVTSIDFKDAYIHIPIQEQSRKFHVEGRSYQFKVLPFGLSTAPLEFTVIAKEVKLMTIHKGIRIHQYLDDWLVRARSHQVCLQHTQDLLRICQELGWLVNLEKSELEPKQIFDFVGYQFDLRAGRVRSTPDRWQSLQDKILEILSLPACPLRQFMSLIGLLTATGSPRPTTHETYTVASQKQLESVRITRKSDPDPQVPAPPLTMMAKRIQCSYRPTITPNKTCSVNFYRRNKRRVWRSLKRTHCKRGLVTARKQVAYKLPRIKGSLSILERASRPLYRQNITCGNRQHYGSILHKQGRRHEVGPSVPCYGEY